VADIEAGEPSFTVDGIVTLVNVGATLATTRVLLDEPALPFEPVTLTLTVNEPGRPYLWPGPLQVVPLIDPVWAPVPSP
jgi:hypothetical protein